MYDTICLDTSQSAKFSVKGILNTSICPRLALYTTPNAHNKSQALQHIIYLEGIKIYNSATTVNSRYRSPEICLRVFISGAQRVVDDLPCINSSIHPSLQQFLWAIPVRIPYLGADQHRCSARSAPSPLPARPFCCTPRPEEPPNHTP